MIYIYTQANNQVIEMNETESGYEMKRETESDNCQAPPQHINQDLVEILDH